jgi:hypothetical protein
MPLALFIVRRFRHRQSGNWVRTSGTRHKYIKNPSIVSFSVYKPSCTPPRPHLATQPHPKHYLPTPAVFAAIPHLFIMDTFTTMESFLSSSSHYPTSLHTTSRSVSFDDAPSLNLPDVPVDSDTIQTIQGGCTIA